MNKIESQGPKNITENVEKKFQQSNWQEKDYIKYLQSKQTMIQMVQKDSNEDIRKEVSISGEVISVQQLLNKEICQPLEGFNDKILQLFGIFEDWIIYRSMQRNEIRLFSITSKQDVLFYQYKSSEDCQKVCKVTDTQTVIMEYDNILIFKYEKFSPNELQLNDAFHIEKFENKRELKLSFVNTSNSKNVDYLYYWNYEGNHIQYFSIVEGKNMYEIKINDKIHEIQAFQNQQVLVTTKDNMMIVFEKDVEIMTQQLKEMSSLYSQNQILLVKYKEKEDFYIDIYKIDPKDLKGSLQKNYKQVCLIQKSFNIIESSILNEDFFIFKEFAQEQICSYEKGQIKIRQLKLTFFNAYMNDKYLVINNSDTLHAFKTKVDDLPEIKSILNDNFCRIRTSSDSQYIAFIGFKHIKVYLLNSLIFQKQINIDSIKNIKTMKSRSNYICYLVENQVKLIDITQSQQEFVEDVYLNHFYEILKNLQDQEFIVCQNKIGFVNDGYLHIANFKGEIVQKMEVKDLYIIYLFDNSQFIALVLQGDNNKNAVLEIRTTDKLTLISKYKYDTEMRINFVQILGNLNRSLIIQYQYENSTIMDIYSNETFDFPLHQYNFLQIIQDRYLILVDKKTNKLKVIDIQLKRIVLIYDQVSKAFANDDYICMKLVNGQNKIVQNILIQTNLSSSFVSFNFEKIHSEIIMNQFTYFTQDQTLQKLYERAFVRKQDEILRSIIYPYDFNSLHYFAMSKNIKALHYCFGIQNIDYFLTDKFGRTPLDYAIETKDKNVINAFYSCLTQIEDKDAIVRILNKIPLELLIQNYTPAVLVLIKDWIPNKDPNSYPNIEIPQYYPLQENYIKYSDHFEPYYSYKQTFELHPNQTSLVKNLIQTIVINTPVPNDFTFKSLELLYTLKNYKSDEVMKSIPIQAFLKRKWNRHAKTYFQIQFLIFISLLISLSVFFSLLDSKFQSVLQFFEILSIILTVYFIIYEIIQIKIQKKEYFKQQVNILDLFRLALVIVVIVCSHYNLELAISLSTYMFILVWFEALSQLAVYEATRYFIKMILETVSDIQTFLIILVLAMVSYTQIMFISTQLVSESEELSLKIKHSYVLSMGELGEYDEQNIHQFIAFVLFSFFIPLLLMNMLIAIMGDVYERVQSNATAADARILAQMIHEMEEMIRYFYYFKGNQIKESYIYIFQTRNIEQGEDESEEWEGMVGELRGFITKKFKDNNNEMKTQKNEIQALRTGIQDQLNTQKDEMKTLIQEQLSTQINDIQNSMKEIKNTIREIKQEKK